MVGEWWLRLLVLALVVTSECEAVGDAQGSTAANATAGALTNPSIDGHWESIKYGEDHYDGARAKSYMGIIVFGIMIISNFYLFKDDLIALMTMKNCQDYGVEHDPKSFNEIAKIHSNTRPIDISRYEPVLLQIHNCIDCLDKQGNLIPRSNSTKESIRLYPYDHEHAGMDGGLAFMVYDVGHDQGHEETHNTIMPGDLLVSVDCEQFDEAKKETMKWFPGGLNDLLNDGDDSGLSKKFAKSLIFYHPKDEYQYCPSKNGEFIIMQSQDSGSCWDEHGLEPVEEEESVEEDESAPDLSQRELEEEKSKRKKKKKTKKKLPTKADTKAGPDMDGDGDFDRNDGMVMVERFFESAKGAPVPSVADFPAGGWDMGRQRLPIHPQRGLIDEYSILAIVMIFLYAGATYFFSTGITSFDIDGKEDIFRKLGYTTTLLTGEHLADANYGTKILKDETAQMCLYVLNGLILLVLYLVLCLFLFRFFGSNIRSRMSRSRAGKLYIQEFMCFSIMLMCLWITAKQYVEARILNSQWSVQFNTVGISLQWVNTYLALLYFADVIIKYLNAFYKFPLFGLFDDRASDLILGVTGALGEMLGMMDTVRGMHGWGSGCELSELGLTFRRIATEAPESFPTGCELNLQCTESDLSFDDVYHLNFANDSATNSARQVTKNAKFDDGNMCVLQCAIKNTQGEKMSKQTLIWCKDSGLFNARWTLSSHREAQQKTLCPSATDAAIKPTNLILNRPEPS